MGEKNELHLTDSCIRGAVIRHLRSLGYDSVSETLRIYGYGEQQGQELTGFQGHIAVSPSPAPASYMAVVFADTTNGTDCVYIAYHPELGFGCLGQGVTQGEALASLDSARIDWVKSLIDDGQPIPEPFALPAIVGMNTLMLRSKWIAEESQIRPGQEYLIRKDGHHAIAHGYEQGKRLLLCIGVVAGYQVGFSVAECESVWEMG